MSTNVQQYNKIDMDALFKRDILTVGIDVQGETDKYVVTVRFSGVLEEIRKAVKQNNGKLEYKAIAQAMSRVFNSGDVSINCTCLHPNTKIKLLDGTNPTVEEMCKRFEKGEKLWVFSTDENGDFKPGEVEKVWQTKTTQEFIKVTLDNGEEILTTPEHPYMLRDGSYSFAMDLQEGQSLMPLYFIVKIERIILEDTPVYDIKVKTWENFLVDAGVVLHNCPDAKYRMRYWQNKNGYGTQYEPRPSDITNPNDTKGAGCKHTMLVISRLDWMMKVGSVINNYIKYCQTNLQKSYADYIFPKIYGMKYDKAIQLGLFDNGLLPSDQQTLSDITAQQQQNKDEKGRWVQGNEYRFTKKDTSDNDKGIIPDENQQEFKMNATETEFEKPGSKKQMTIDDYDDEGTKLVGNGEEIKPKRKYVRHKPYSPVGKKAIPVSKDQISMFDDEEEDI